MSLEAFFFCRYTGSDGADAKYNMLPHSRDSCTISDIRRSLKN